MAVNEWCAVREGGFWIVEMSVQSMGEMGKNFCPNFLQPFLEIIDGRGCADGSQELIPISYNLRRKARPSPSAAVLTMEYLVRVSSRAASSVREKKQSLFHVQKAREYLECGNQVSPNRHRFKE